ncbi:hypothetical protein QEN19_000408 [Hanseniaspora menglaensis]
MSAAKKKLLFKKACGNCSRRHFSCSGKRPCENCVNKNIECTDIMKKQKVPKGRRTPKVTPQTTEMPQEAIQVVGPHKRVDGTNTFKINAEGLQKPASQFNSPLSELKNIKFSTKLELDSAQQGAPYKHNKVLPIAHENNLPSLMSVVQNDFQQATTRSSTGDINNNILNPYNGAMQISSSNPEGSYGKELGSIKNDKADMSSLRQGSSFYSQQIDTMLNTAAMGNEGLSNDVFSDSSSEDEKNSNNENHSYYRHQYDELPTRSSTSTNTINNNQHLYQQQTRQAIYEKKELKKKKKLERLEICKYLGPKGFEILIDSNIDLLHQHFPLVPIEKDNGDLFNQEDALFNSHNKYCNIENSGNNETEYDCKCDIQSKERSTSISIDFRIINLEKNLLIPYAYSEDTNDSKGKGHSFILELPPLQSGESRIISNPEWTHSLQYKKPSEIYSKITQPFLHTHGFTSLLEYIKKRFCKADVIKICYDIAAIRPVFIASCINFQEEDMIFMEHCFQRTLLEYASFIEEMGNPTIIWRRTGQISYVNDEFLMLTGWTRQQLLGKMTFVIEILDDKSSLIFFKNFKAVCYSDYTGFVNVPTMKVLTPKKGKYVECSSFFIVKRDTFGLPTFTVGNFLPK